MTRFYALLPVVIVLALVVLGWNAWETSQAKAVEPDLEFEMEVPGGITVAGGGCTTVGTAPTQKGDATCSPPGGNSFIVGVQLANTGETSGQIVTWQAVIEWSAGLTGPGDLGSTKTSGFRSGHGCPDLEASAAPWLDQPHTAGVGCVSFSGPFTDAEATNMIADIELTCGSSPSQEQVTMLVGTGPTISQRTFVEAIFFNNPIPFADKDGSEVITIECPGIPVGGLAELPLLAEAASEASESSGTALYGLAAAATAISAAALTLLGAARYAKQRRSL